MCPYQQLFVWRCIHTHSACMRSLCGDAYIHTVHACMHTYTVHVHVHAGEAWKGMPMWLFVASGSGVSINVGETITLSSFAEAA